MVGPVVGLAAEVLLLVEEVDLFVRRYTNLRLLSQISVQCARTRSGCANNDEVQALGKVAANEAAVEVRNPPRCVPHEAPRSDWHQNRRCRDDNLNRRTRTRLQTAWLSAGH